MARGNSVRVCTRARVCVECVCRNSTRLLSCLPWPVLLVRLGTVSVIALCSLLDVETFVQDLIRISLQYASISLLVTIWRRGMPGQWRALTTCEHRGVFIFPQGLLDYFWEGLVLTYQWVFPSGNFKTMVPPKTSTLASRKL